MCGGIGLNFKRISKTELKKFYTEAQINQFKKIGEYRSFFWDKRPLLPVKIGSSVKLVDWENRDKLEPFPLTGWAKQESVTEGKWLKYHPQKIEVLADRGFEKKTWFNFKAKEFPAYLIENNGFERVYMLTQKAGADYEKITGHNRMPIGEKEEFIKENNG